MQRQIIYHHNVVRITEKRKNVPTGRVDEWTIRRETTSQSRTIKPDPANIPDVFVAAIVGNICLCCLDKT